MKAFTNIIIASALFVSGTAAAGAPSAQDAYGFCKAQAMDTAAAMGQNNADQNWRVLPIGDGSCHTGSRGMEIIGSCEGWRTPVLELGKNYDGGDTGPMAARTKADILIESIYESADLSTTALVGVDMEILAEEADNPGIVPHFTTMDDILYTTSTTSDDSNDRIVVHTLSGASTGDVIGGCALVDVGPMTAETTSEENGGDGSTHTNIDPQEDIKPAPIDPDGTQPNTEEQGG